ncbi:DUF445 domain-containing protein [Halobacillus amylolyticus]|uniref:DUF445 family protein n=1 Tax=Halobacillus amylolyticus TaxID=2932259 RepID=A0ABY4HEB1_9BACI|nr:DUF445 family protein [Halobacillus amylolyticus]UOR13226.1 DUF445 family protein [Halobacillus amylolyticus]
MDAFVLILFMMLIGAAIGGVTNHLAIKMLFRPYKAIKIGKFQLPFTPGLIPKRREELSRQLGEMVVNHLLTADGLRRKINGQGFENQLTTFAQEEIEKLLNKNETMQEFLGSLEIDLNKDRLEESVSFWVEERYESMMSETREQKVGDLLSDSWKGKLEGGADQFSVYIQDRIVRYLDSHEGKERIAALIDDYLDNQGFLGNMIASFMGSERLIDRVHPVLIKYVSAKEATDWLQAMIHTEIKKSLDQPVKVFEEKIGKESIASTLGKAVSQALPIEKWMSRSIADWTKPLQSKVILDVVPVMVPKFTDMLSSRIDRMMASMNLSGIVEEQVASFPVERLEEIVLGISRREFKMITYLGALLGGMIGVIQGIIVLFLG